MADSLRVFAVGVLKEPPLRDLAEEYRARISRFASFRVDEIKDNPVGDEDPRKYFSWLEERLPLGAGERETPILCDVAGKVESSEAFSARIAELLRAGRSPLFLVGGSLGWSPEIRARVPLRLSFSPMTLPHGLFRVVLLEQIYRAFCIRAGHPYHK